MFLLVMIVTFSCFCQTLRYARIVWSHFCPTYLEHCPSQLSLPACRLRSLSFRTLYLMVILSVTGGLSSVQRTMCWWWGQLHPCCISWNLSTVGQNFIELSSHHEYTFKIAQPPFFSHLVKIISYAIDNDSDRHSSNLCPSLNQM